MSEIKTLTVEEAKTIKVQLVEELGRLHGENMALSTRIDSLRVELYDVERIVDNDASPIKIGDAVEWQDGNKRGQITHLDASYGDRFDYWVRQFKKDGTLHKRVEKIYTWGVSTAIKKIEPPKTVL